MAAQSGVATELEVIDFGCSRARLPNYRRKNPLLKWGYGTLLRRK
jgi:hypothetical protein